MKLTLLLIAIMIIGFAVPLFFVQDIEGFYNTFGFSGKNFLERPYVVVTSIFMHGGIEHLLSNLLVLIFFGLAVEAELGVKKMLVIFFLGAFAGDFFSLFFYPFDAVAIGASAGIFALVGAGMLVRPFDLSLSGAGIMPLALLGMSYIIYNIYGFFFPAGNISYIAHFGGLFVGLAFGFKTKGMKKSMLIIFASAAVLVVLMAMIKLILK